jgi:hypothetical protein
VMDGERCARYMPSLICCVVRECETELLGEARKWFLTVFIGMRASWKQIGLYTSNTKKKILSTCSYVGNRERAKGQILMLEVVTS